MKRLLTAFAFGLIAVSHAGASVAPRLTAKENVALGLLQKIKETGYGTRSLCIYMKQYAVGIQAVEHWSQDHIVVVRGTLDRFPTQFTKVKNNVRPFVLDMPNGPDDWDRFKVLEQVGSTRVYATTGTVDGRPADICVFESKPVPERVGG
ncbi:MAG TPA: hypothetical protein VFV50_19515 [Bdellovibrionales bacterium]|nr:hypothetical protein [Bdellovibrionales bacterium]